MWYLGNHLTDFDEICMTVHISRSDPIGNQKFESQIVDCSNLKNRKKVISRMSNFDKILRGGVDLDSRP